ncbi:MAG: hypothetical protein IPQ07_38285 [Myxococcales bacterium]|nr:hypothetical protein [Myxococcales bacterium]
MERTLVAFTTLLISAGVAHASHPPQTLPSAGTQTPHPFVVTQPRKLDRSLDRVFARQMLPAQPLAAAANHVIYLNRGGAVLWPGDANDARTQTSSIVSEPTSIGSWDVDDDLWAETVACVRDIYRPFDVTITDEDPGDAPHMEAIFGGHPNDVGLPDNVAGVSPFMEDCSVIDSSIVFTFTDVMPDDARTMCEVMAQEIAHSYGLDHEMLASDPMTYLPYAGERTFQDIEAPCGENGNRLCGIGGTMCRRTQNSVQLLTQRLGPAGGTTPPSTTTPATDDAEGGAGCSASGGRSTLAFALGALTLLRRRRSRA